MIGRWIAVNAWRCAISKICKFDPLHYDKYRDLSDLSFVCVSNKYERSCRTRISFCKHERRIKPTQKRPNQKPTGQQSVTDADWHVRQVCCSSWGRFHFQQTPSHDYGCLSTVCRWCAILSESLVLLNRNLSDLKFEGSFKSSNHNPRYDDLLKRVWQRRFCWECGMCVETAIWTPIDRSRYREYRCVITGGDFQDISYEYELNADTRSELNRDKRRIRRVTGSAVTSDGERLRHQCGLSPLV